MDLYGASPSRRYDSVEGIPFRNKENSTEGSPTINSENFADTEQLKKRPSSPESPVKDTYNKKSKR